MRTLVLATIFLLAAASAFADDQGDWPMFGHDLRRSFSNPGSGLTPQNVGALKLAWSVPTEDAVTAAPTVVDGVVYVGAWDGYFYALTTQQGVLLWKFAVDCQNTVVPVPPRCLASGDRPPDRSVSDGGLISSSAAVVDGTVYFAGGRTVYALRAHDGTLVWKRIICGNPDDLDCESDQHDGTFILSSPAVHAGLVFVGSTVDGQDGYRGGIVALDAHDGTIRWRFEVDPLLDAHGHVLLNKHGLPAGGYNRGCGNVWASVSIDPKRREVYVGTSDCDYAAPPPYHESLLALDEKSGRLRWVFSPIPTDTCDLEFGATANVIDVGAARLIGVGGKNGIYYLVDRRTGRQVWATQVVPGGNSGGFYGGAALTDARIISATGIGDTFMIPGCPFNFGQEPSLHALDLVTGNKVWQRTGNTSFGATTAGDGVVFVSSLGNLMTPPSELHAYDVKTGELLLNQPLFPFSLAPPTPAKGGVFIGLGDILSGFGGAINAYLLP
jgi:outer membrane protein assembly factor BamB